MKRMSQNKVDTKIMFYVAALLPALAVLTCI